MNSAQSAASQARGGPRWVTAPADRPQHSQSAPSSAQQQAPPKSPEQQQQQQQQAPEPSSHSTPRSTPILSKLSIATAQNALASLHPNSSSPTHQHHRAAAAVASLASPPGATSSLPASTVAVTVATTPTIATVQHSPPSNPSACLLESVASASSTNPPLTSNIADSTPRVPTAAAAAAAADAASTSTPTHDTPKNAQAGSSAQASASSSRRRAGPPSVAASPPPRSPLVSSSRQAAQAAARAIRSSASTATPPPTFAPPIGRAAHNASSPAPMPASDTPQPEAGPSTHGSVAGTEADSTLAEAPKPKKRRRGWKGWAIEVEDEFGHKYLRSPSPEPDRPVDAPPRKRGRPRTRPRGEEQPQAQPTAQQDQPQVHPPSEATEAEAQAQDGGNPPADAEVAVPVPDIAEDVPSSSRRRARNEPKSDADDEPYLPDLDTFDQDEPLASPATSEPVQRGKQKSFMRFQIGSSSKRQRKSSPILEPSTREPKKPRASMPAVQQTENGKERAPPSANTSAKAPRRSDLAATTTNGHRGEASSSRPSTAASNGKSAAQAPHSRDPAGTSQHRGWDKAGRPQPHDSSKATDKPAQRTLDDYFTEEPPAAAPIAPRLGMGAAYPSPPESDERHERTEQAERSERNEVTRPPASDSSPQQHRAHPLPDVQREAHMIISLSAKRREEDEERERKQQQEEEDARRQKRREEVEREQEKERERREREERHRERAARERQEWERVERDRRHQERRESGRYEEWDRRERRDERERELVKREEWERIGEWRGSRDERGRARVVYDERGREVALRDERVREYPLTSPREAPRDPRANGHSKPYYPPPPPHEYRHSSKSSTSSSYHPPPPGYDRPRTSSSYQPLPLHQQPYPPYRSPSHPNAPLMSDRASGDMDWNGFPPQPPPRLPLPGSLAALSQSHVSIPPPPPPQHAARPSSRGLPPPMHSPLMSGPRPLGPPPLLQHSPPIAHGVILPPLPAQPKMHPGMGPDPHDQHWRERERRMSEHRPEHERERGRERGDPRIPPPPHVRQDRRSDSARSGHELFPELHPDVHSEPRGDHHKRPVPAAVPELAHGRSTPHTPREGERRLEAVDRDPRGSDTRGHDVRDARSGDVRGGDPRLLKGGYTDVVPVPFPTGPAYRAPEPRLPRMHPDSSIVLAAPGNQHPTPSKRSDVPYARDHANGFEGLDPGLEENARGFVENVKNNLRTLVQTYFVEPSASRDAFLERIGRDLTSFGWELTDGADGALYSRGAAGAAVQQPQAREEHSASPLQQARERRERRE